LSWINVVRANPVHILQIMNQLQQEPLLPAGSQTQPATDAGFVVARPTPSTVPAAWPPAVSALALAVSACERRDASVQSLQPPPLKGVQPSAFCD
jgi:hypothetical protein